MLLFLFNLRFSDVWLLCMVQPNVSRQHRVYIFIFVLVTEHIHWNVFILNDAETERARFFVVEIDFKIIALNLVALIVFDNSFKLFNGFLLWVFVGWEDVRSSRFVHFVAESDWGAFYVLFAYWTKYTWTRLRHYCLFWSIFLKIDILWNL